MSFAITSKKMICEGCIYWLKIYPLGFGSGEKTHISVTVHRLKKRCLDLNSSDKAGYQIKMIHPDVNNYGVKVKRMHYWKDCYD